MTVTVQTSKTLRNVIKYTTTAANEYVEFVSSLPDKAPYRELNILCSQVCECEFLDADDTTWIRITDYDLVANTVRKIYVGGVKFRWKLPVAGTLRVLGHGKY